MKVGLFICTFNRPDYLKKTLESVSKIKTDHELVLMIVDDKSTNEETKKLISEFQSKTNCEVHVNEKNSRIPYSIKTGYYFLFHNQKCDLVMNLDSDALVKPNIIDEMVKLYDRFPNTILTGFNCLTRNANGSERHKVIESGNGYNRKLSVGGIHMAMNEDTFYKYVNPACLQTVDLGGNWDHVSCLNLQAENKSVVCLVPSVVQHIGFESSMNHREKPDTADDFKDVYLPNVTLFCADCVDHKRMIRVAEESMKEIYFGDVVLLSSQHTIDKRVKKIKPIRSKQEYSDFMIKKLNEYINTTHVLVIQYDGYVKNHLAWDDSWLEYDYIGATWWYNDNMNVGNGGFSLRSKRLQEILATDEEIKITHPEDDSICRRYRPYLEKKYGIKFAPEDVAKKFSIEGYKQPDQKYYNGQFGFHGNHVKFTRENEVTVNEKKTVFDPNMKNTIILNQFFGLGDILFCIEIARKFIKKGHRVIFPVEPHYANISRHFPDIQFIDKNLLNIDYNNKKIVEMNGVTVVPLRYSDSIMKVPYTDCMKSKYMMFELDWKEWRKIENNWVRFPERENKLFELLGIKPTDEYCVVNMQFRNGGRGSRNITLNHGMKTVEMSMIPGFTLLDWAKVLENATMIHTVSTSIIYLLEMIDCKAKEIKIYIRRPDEKNHKNYDYILTNINKYVLE